MGLALFQSCSKCNFIILQKRPIVWGIKRRNRIFWEATSFFEALFIDFSSHQKFEFRFFSVYVQVPHWILTPLTSPFLAHSLSLSSSHPPLYSFCCPSNRLIHATHLSSLCCAEYSCSAITIGGSTRKVMTFIHKMSFLQRAPLTSIKSSSYSKGISTCLRGALMKYVDIIWG